MPYMKYDLVPPGGHMAIAFFEGVQPPIDLASTFASARWAFLERAPAGDATRLVRELGPEIVIVSCDAQRSDDLVLVRDLAKTAKGELLVYTNSRSPESDALLLDCGVDVCLHHDDPGKLIRAVLRAAMRRAEGRSSAGKSQAELSIQSFGDLHIDADRFEVRVGSQVVHFPAAEYRILVTLASSAGHVLSPRSLMEAANGTFYSDVEARDSAKVFIGRIRNRLAEHGIPKTAIRNVRGFGYVLEPRDCSIDYSRLLRV